ncbi:unnamed protein product [Blepharisma stoltei]|uniref:Uncharacterized protein n=1 Tax=Blepharisma stoltei TaxID=1481888 RepID=A0AAU9JYF3_9CILI|nr:unnamed protein product [Blepharisma stoltei]
MSLVGEDSPCTPFSDGIKTYGSILTPFTKYVAQAEVPEEPETGEITYNSADLESILSSRVRKHSNFPIEPKDYHTNWSCKCYIF